MITRREFLAAIAAAAAPQPQPQIERFTRSGTRQRIIVIGAGRAGLCAAYELQALGHTDYHIPFSTAMPDPAAVDTFLKTITAPGVQPAFIH